MIRQVVPSPSSGRVSTFPLFRPSPRHLPAADGNVRPDASLVTGNLGQTAVTAGRCTTVPSASAAPASRLETVTIARGFIDHSTHSEPPPASATATPSGSRRLRPVLIRDVPLLDPDDPNPLELFQIWLNSPPRTSADPHFDMFWRRTRPSSCGEEAPGPVPRHQATSTASGAHSPPRSWAARPDNHVAICGHARSGASTEPPLSTLPQSGPCTTTAVR